MGFELVNQSQLLDSCSLSKLHCLGIEDTMALYSQYLPTAVSLCIHHY